MKEINRAHDGNGQEAKRGERNCVTTNPNNPCQWQDEAPRYYIRSSVLGQAVVSEVNSTGKKLKTYVRAAGTVLAWQVLSHQPNGAATQDIRFTHNDAAGLSIRTTVANGATVSGDGMALGCSRVAQLLDSGAAIPAALAAFQNRPGFSFESLGLGLFRYYIPNASTLSDQIAGNNSTDGEVVRVRTDVPSGTWGPFVLPFMTLCNYSGTRYSCW